ncbi:MAG: endopeptidase La [Bdellovibrionia bacterium]
MDLILPILPLKNTVVFPSLFVPLSAGRIASVQAVEAALLNENKTLLVIAQRDPSIESPEFNDLFHVGTQVVIKKAAHTDDRIDFLVQGLERVLLKNFEQTAPYLIGRSTPMPFRFEENQEVEALKRSIVDLATQIFQFSPLKLSVNLEQLMEKTPDALQLAYMLSSILNLGIEKEQKILEADSTLHVLKMLYADLLNELEVLELRAKITSHAQTEISKQQKEYLLRQQLRAIQEELGESGTEKSEIEELKTRLKEANIPDPIHTEIEKELNRFERLTPSAPDFQILRAHLEFIAELPWNRSTQDHLDLTQAKKVLDEDHFDLDEVKERILEHLSVMKLNPQARPPILCFVGPPGVGKTSLGQSIARAMGRKFERMSLGGLHDEAELRGHRKTYVGAMPGRILQAIRRSQSNNPILMLDEIDKIGRDFRGDPAAALLEILDPAQNYAFRDHYLDLPFNLSPVFFMTTANQLETIPPPLLDRMEIIRLSGYSEEEKVAIAQRYLIPLRLKEAGLQPKDFHIPPEVLLSIVQTYTREAGVRELERILGRLSSKIARRFAEGHPEAVVLTTQLLGDLLGPEKFRFEKLRHALPAGVATTLAWTPTGGDILYIEAHHLPHTKELRLTGQLGEVMKESAQAAQTYISSHAQKWDIQPFLLQKGGLHIHVPAGATPKDGPSAGLALVVAMVSALTQTPCRADLAMTGEITLSGLILPVGGIKEKILAAKRIGITSVILPLENKTDFNELSESIQMGIQVAFVERMDEALLIALPSLTQKPIHPKAA